MLDHANSAAPVAAVTGGGRGMGAAIARGLHARGHALAPMSPGGSAEAPAADSGGVRMNAFPPGHIAGLDHEPDTAAVPTRRIGTAAEIAETAASPPSDDAGCITGRNVRVDGGLARHV